MSKSTGMEGLEDILPHLSPKDREELFMSQLMGSGGSSRKSKAVDERPPEEKSRRRRIGYHATMAVGSMIVAESMSRVIRTKMFSTIKTTSPKAASALILVNGVFAVTCFYQIGMTIYVSTTSTPTVDLPSMS